MRVIITRGKGRHRSEDVTIWDRRASVVRETETDSGWWKGQSVKIHGIYYTTNRVAYMDPLLELSPREFKKFFGFRPERDSCVTYEWNTEMKEVKQDG